MDHAASRLTRKSSSQAASLRRRRRECLPRAFLIRLWAMCLMVVTFCGGFSVLIRHSSSRKVMSMTQCRLFSISQWLRTIDPRTVAAAVREVR
jgi:hypothetical protein